MAEINFNFVNLGNDNVIENPAFKVYGVGE